jgi:hypothetical protein
MSVRDVIQLLNDKIEKINDEIGRLKTLIEDNNLKHNFHLKEIEANYNTKLDDFNVKYNSDILAVNANIVSRITSVCTRQDETIEKVLDIQDETIKEMLETVDELNSQMNAVQFNISSIMGHRNEHNNFVNNELIAIRGKINELETEMPVPIFKPCDNKGFETFCSPKYTNSNSFRPFEKQYKIGLGNLCLCVENLKRLPLIKDINMEIYTTILINQREYRKEQLSLEDKNYIKQICDKQGIRLDNAGF